MSNTAMDVHYSSATDDWPTPPEVFAILDREYCFTLDPCATPGNAKCMKFYTKEDDGLRQPWEGRVFCNPPYGRAVGKWVRKAYEEAQRGALVVLLIPSRTDTSYWHDYVMKADEVHLLRGRLKFGDATTDAPFPSAIIVFKPDARAGGPKFYSRKF